MGVGLEHACDNLDDSTDRWAAAGQNVRTICAVTLASTCFVIRFHRFLKTGAVVLLKINVLHKPGMGGMKGS